MKKLKLTRTTLQLLTLTCAQLAAANGGTDGNGACTFNLSGCVAAPNAQPASELGACTRISDYPYPIAT